MSDDELTSRVIGVIAATQHIARETITPEKTFQELGIDSLDGINILFAVENEFNISIPDDAATRISNFSGDLTEGLMRAGELELFRRQPAHEVVDGPAGLSETAQRVFDIDRPKVAAGVPVELEVRVAARGNLLDAHQHAFALGRFQVGRDLPKRPFLGRRPPVLPIGGRKQHLLQPPLARQEVGDGLSHARTVM